MPMSITHNESYKSHVWCVYTCFGYFVILLLLLLLSHNILLRVSGFWLNNNKEISLFNNCNQSETFHLSLRCFVLFILQLLNKCINVQSAWDDSRWIVATREELTTQCHHHRHHLLHASHSRNATLYAYLSLFGCRVFSFRFVSFCRFICFNFIWNFMLVCCASSLVLCYNGW